MSKIIHIIGGGTVSHVRNHFGLCAPVYGDTARALGDLCRERIPTMRSVLHLTRMAGGRSLETNEDIAKLIEGIVADPATKIVFMPVALVDFAGTIGSVESGKYAQRLRSDNGQQTMTLTPTAKIIGNVRKHRKDIFLVGFKTTTDFIPEEQYIAGLHMLKEASCNLVLANDVVTRNNMIITPEEAHYHDTTDRAVIERELVDMAALRSNLTFTRSTVVKGEPVPWESPLVPGSLRTIVDYCISNRAYKAFRGSTVGHFACKLSDNTFLTSIRKTDFNDLGKIGLVRIETDGPDTVLAYGAKPSVGGQSQRIVFNNHPQFDCIVHFHCPIREGSEVPTVSQREYECGSHECGRNTSHGLRQFGNLSAVYLDQHGPNIVFRHDIDPQEVIDFIEANFDLSQKTGGYINLADAGTSLGQILKTPDHLEDLQAIDFGYTMKCVCSECGHEQDSMDHCENCRGFRVILQSVAEDVMGKEWRRAFYPVGHPLALTQQDMPAGTILK